VWVETERCRELGRFSLGLGPQELDGHLGPLRGVFEGEPVEEGGRDQEPTAEGCEYDPKSASRHLSSSPSTSDGYPDSALRAHQCASQPSRSRLPRTKLGQTADADTTSSCGMMDRRLGTSQVHPGVSNAAADLARLMVASRWGCVGMYRSAYRDSG
jgi:hypothetical protein